MVTSNQKTGIILLLNMRVPPYLVSGMLYSGKAGDDGLPGEELLHDAAARVLDGRVNVDHLVSDPQLMDQGLEHKHYKHDY
jgi:hypothetical protein